MDDSSDSSDTDDTCPHINGNTIDTSKCGKKVLKPDSWDKCQNRDCTFSSNSLFVCLKCGYISCIDNNHSGHADNHCHKKRTKHPIAIDIHSHEIWCFLCQQQIYNDTSTQSIQQLVSQLKSLQKQHLTRIKDDDNIIVVSEIKAKEFEEKDKIENADAQYKITLLRKIFNHWKNNTKEMKKKNKLSGNKRKRNEINHNTDINNSKVNTAPPKKKIKRTQTKNFSRRTGLRNLGNTCYFNSSVQCLNSTDTFRKFFLNLPSLVPKNALTAPLPDLPTLKSSKNRNNNKKYRKQRSIQTRSITKPKTKPKRKPKPKPKVKVIETRRRSVRLQNRRKIIETDSDSDDTEMKESSEGSDTDIMEESSEESSSNELVAPSRLLLGRKTTLLYKTMENVDEELLDNIPISLSAEVYSLLRIFESGKYSVITPQRLAMSIWNTVGFRSYRQQDAQEFLNLFLERLEQEIKAFENKNQQSSHYVKQSFECSMISETTCDICSHKSYYRPPGHKCITLDIYGTITPILKEKKNELELKEKEYDDSDKENIKISNKKNGKRRGRRALNYNGLNLTLRHLNTDRAFERAIKSYKLCSLMDLLNSLNSPTIFDGDNMYKCDKCNKKVTAIKRDYYEILPNVLVFHLCRAYYNLKNNKQEKLQNYITFPLKDLKMNEYCFNDENRNNNNNINEVGYDLVGVLVHCGKSMSYGHYISYCYHNEMKTWFKFDDNKVSVVTENSVMKSQAYLLFYEKQNISGWVDDYIHDIRQQMEL